MTSPRDITNQRFGHLTALYSTGENKGTNGRVWVCVCDCGNTVEIPISYLSWKTSCGCMSPNVKYEPGMRFGYLTLKQPVGKLPGTGYRAWECVCDCGNITYVRPTDLKNGHIVSCGCVRKDNGYNKAEMMRNIRLQKYHKRNDD